MGALRLIDEVRVSLIVCLGDVLDYGVFPDERIAPLAERGIPTLRGNHDRWAIGNQSMGTNASDLTPAARRHLKATVPSRASTVEGVRIAAHHARPGDDLRGVMTDAGEGELREVLPAADADVVVLGHTHRPMELRLGDRMVVNPGAPLRDPPRTAGTGTCRRRAPSACWSCPNGIGRCSRRGRDTPRR